MPIYIIEQAPTTTESITASTAVTETDIEQTESKIEGHDKSAPEYYEDILRKSDINASVGVNIQTDVHEDGWTVQYTGIVQIRAYFRYYKDKKAANEAFQDWYFKRYYPIESDPSLFAGKITKDIKNDFSYFTISGTSDSFKPDDKSNTWYEGGYLSGNTFVIVGSIYGKDRDAVDKVLKSLGYPAPDQA